VRAHGVNFGDHSHRHARSCGSERGTLAGEAGSYDKNVMLGHRDGILCERTGALCVPSSL